MRNFILKRNTWLTGSSEKESKMKWQVDRIGKPEDLEELSKFFHSPDLQILKKDERFILASSSFDNSTDIQEVKRRIAW